MAKKKKKRKKKSIGQLQHKKLLKEQFKDFFIKLGLVALAADAEEAFYKIPYKELFFLHKARFCSFRVERAENAKMSNRDIKTLQQVVVSFMKSKMLVIADGKPQISLYDYYSAGLSLLHYLRGLNDDTFPEAKEVKERFKMFTSLVEKGNLPKKTMLDHAVFLSWLFSSVNQGFFRFKYDTVNNKNKTSYERFLADVIEPEVRHYNIDGVNRPAYRVGYMWKNNELKWVKLKAADLGVSGSFDGLMLDVYIQSHALHRMEERLDAYKHTEPNINMFSSFLDTKIIKNYKGQTLIQYSDFDNKLGYFRADIVDGTVLIKTFLFLTNDATPEGEKLKELAGLSIVGKRYFKIDTLSTFLNSDIEKDEKLKKLFIDAGCESLFHIKTISKHNVDEQKTAGALLKYLEKK